MAEFIKRDALKDFYCKSCPVGDGDKCMGEGCKVYEARKLIANIPSVIEVEPVRYGQWENPTESKPRMFERNGHTFIQRQCTECRLWSIQVAGSIPYKYCPSCGVKMRFHTQTEEVPDASDSSMMDGEG